MNPFDLIQKMIFGVFWMWLIMFFVLFVLDILFFRFLSKKKQFQFQSWGRAILSALVVFFVSLFLNLKLNLKILSEQQNDIVHSLIGIILFALIFITIKRIYQLDNKQLVNAWWRYILYKIISFFIISILGVVIAMGFLADYLQSNIKNQENLNQVQQSDNNNLPTYIPSKQEIAELVKLQDKNFIVKDTDFDGLIDFREYTYSTSYTNRDSDGDGYLDGEEVKNGYSPNSQGKLEIEKTFDCNNRACLISAAVNCSPMRFREATSSPDGIASMEIVIIGKEDNLCKFTDYREINDKREEGMIVQTAGICWYDDEFMKDFETYLNQSIKIRPGNEEIPDKNFCKFTVNFSTKQEEDNSPEDLTESTNWQVYQNDKHGFEFKYPSDWRIDEGNDNIRVFKSTSQKDPYGYPVEYSLILNIDKIDNNLSLEEWLDGKKKSGIVGDILGEFKVSRIFKSQNIKDIKGLRYIDYGIVNYLSASYKYGNNIYTWTAMKDMSFEKLLEEVLNNFTFLEQ